MSRVINPESAGRNRARLMQWIALACAQLMKERSLDTRADELAFIVAALEEIAAGIDASTAAWEKRDYWLKADQFRRQWEWTGRSAQRLRAAIERKNTSEAVAALADLAPRLAGVTLPKRLPKEMPWKGAHEKLTAAR
ncbi:MAG TPA: hypothetical protein VJJ70_02390 [Anaerolineales bacterium]|nr:hypothetical protein [Anaerolineales bacterium]